MPLGGSVDYVNGLTRISSTRNFSTTGNLALTGSETTLDKHFELSSGNLRLNGGTTTPTISYGRVSTGQLKLNGSIVTSQTSKYIPESDIEGIVLVHLCYGPSPLLPVPAHHAPLVAGLAQGHHREVIALLDVVGVRRAWCCAH